MQQPDCKIYQCQTYLASVGLSLHHVVIQLLLLQGTSLKYMVVYQTPWWKAQGFLGKIVNTVYVSGNSTVYVSECLDNSPGESPALLLLLLDLCTKQHSV